MATSSRGPIAVLVHGGTGRVGRTVLAVASSSKEIVVRGLLDPRRPRQEPLDGVSFFDHIPSGEHGIDVVVDFSHPDGAAALFGVLEGTGIRLVCGTTGLTEVEQKLLKKYSKEAAVFYDTNMSYGISVMERLLKTAAPLLQGADIEVVEYHHRRKRDFPSGTTYRLVRAIDPQAQVVAGRETPLAGAGGVIHAHSVRLGEIPGEHRVHFAAGDEVVTVSHQALSRVVFARGALRAVAFIVGKGPGIYSMEDLTGV